MHLERKDPMEQGNTKATQRAGNYFSCPICGESLEKGEKTCRCPKGHSFDIASEGYVHLLPRNRMHSDLPGDTKEMVAARRRFLESGAYALFEPGAEQHSAFLHGAFPPPSSSGHRLRGRILYGPYGGRFERKRL